MKYSRKTLMKVILPNTNVPAYVKKEILRQYYHFVFIIYFIFILYCN